VKQRRLRRTRGQRSVRRHVVSHPHTTRLEHYVEIIVVVSIPLVFTMIWLHTKHVIPGWSVDIVAAMVSALVGIVLFQKRRERAKGMHQFDAVVEPLLPAATVYPATVVASMNYEGMVIYAIAVGLGIFFIGTIATPITFLRKH